jgi:hypothetical protein
MSPTNPLLKDGLMPQPSPHEPSMEKIPASIRRIIAGDQALLASESGLREEAPQPDPNGEAFEPGSRAGARRTFASNATDGSVGADFNALRRAFTPLGGGRGLDRSVFVHAEEELLFPAICFLADIVDLCRLNMAAAGRATIAIITIFEFCLGPQMVLGERLGDSRRIKIVPSICFNLQILFAGGIDGYHRTGSAMWTEEQRAIYRRDESRYRFNRLFPNVILMKNGCMRRRFRRLLFVWLTFGPKYQVRI